VSTHRYRDQSLLYRNSALALTETVPRQTSSFGEGRRAHFVEQRQVLSREPAADWHQTIGHRLIKFRHGDDIPLLGRGRDRARQTSAEGYWPYSVPSRCSRILGWQSCRSAISSKSIRLSLGWMVRKQVSCTLMYRHEGTRFEPDHRINLYPNQSDLRV
jgi:hypothetical protein